MFLYISDKFRPVEAMVSRLDLLVKVRELGGFQSPGLNENLTKFVIDFAVEDLNVFECSQHLKQKVNNFVQRAKQKYRKHSRKYETFIEKEAHWLSAKFELDVDVVHSNEALKKSAENVGRPRKSWENLSERAKRSRITELNDRHPQELAKAAYKKQKVEKIEQYEIIKHIDLNDNKVSGNRLPIKMTPAEALSLKVQTNLSDEQYQMIRNSSIAHNADIYPTLHALLEEKKKCWPPNMQFSETSASCSLQNILDHTASRLCQLHEVKELP